MTSTNIFSGRAGDRNSSRVLRPPGGGATDVLGLTSSGEPLPAKKPSPRNVSSIVEGTNICPPEVVAKVFEEKPQVAAKVFEEKPEVAAKVFEEKPEVAAKEVTQPLQPSNSNLTTNGGAPPQRVRAPPGGFSSGFW